MNVTSTDMSISIAEKSLDALWLKQQIISDNIANVDTPGYKSKSVEFEGLLQKAVLYLNGDESSAAEKIDQLQAKVVTDTDTSLREDGNNVDIDSENIELVRSQLQYMAVIGGLSGELSRMKYAINGSDR